MTDKITVICECCAKEIQENKANAYYKINNYLIVCDECYEKLLQAQVMADEREKLNKWLPIVTRLEEQFKSHEKAKSIDYKTYAEQVFTELEQLKQALTEIKQIAEKDFNHTCWQTYEKQLKQILQKISEVLDE